MTYWPAGPYIVRSLSLRLRWIAAENMVTDLAAVLTRAQELGQLDGARAREAVSLFRKSLATEPTAAIVPGHCREAGAGLSRGASFLSGTHAEVNLPGGNDE